MLEVSIRPFVYRLLTDIHTERDKKEKLYRQATMDDGKAICVHMSNAFTKALLQIGIEAETICEREEFSLTHVDTIFKTKNGEIYFANLIQDILRIQTGMRVRCFGNSQAILEKRMRRQGRLGYFNRIIKKYGKLSSVTTEKIEAMDKKFGFNQKGIYTEDVFQMIGTEMKNRKQIEEFFGTNKPDELVEKKIDFAMNIIGIANKHGKEKIGYREGINYYLKLQKYMITDEESENYIRYFSGYRIENHKKVPETIIVLVKENENKYYHYDEEEKKFIKAKNMEQIKKLDIKYDVRNKETLEKETRNLNEVIDTLEKRKNKEEEYDR